MIGEFEYKSFKYYIDYSVDRKEFVGYTSIYPTYKYDFEEYEKLKTHLETAIDYFLLKSDLIIYKNHNLFITYKGGYDNDKYSGRNTDGSFFLNSNSKGEIEAKFKEFMDLIPTKDEIIAKLKEENLYLKRKLEYIKDLLNND